MLDQQQPHVEWVCLPRRRGAPSPRSGHTSVAVGDELYIFGGLIDAKNHPSGLLTNDLYCFDTVSLAWHRVNTPRPNPPGLAGHAMVTYGSHLIVFGGRTQNGDCTNALWVLALCNPRPAWQLCPAFAAPSPRWGHSMVVWWHWDWDVLPSASALLFGGEDRARLMRNDTYLLDLNSLHFTFLDCLGSLPPPRRHHSAAINNNHMFIHAGCSSSYGLITDTHVLDLATLIWRRVDLSPQPSSLSTGGNGNGYRQGSGSRRQRFSLPPSTPTATAATTTTTVSQRPVQPEPPRTLEPLEPADGKLLQNFRTNVTSHPPVRSLHSTTLVGDRLYLFGGKSAANAALGDLWCLHIPVQRSLRALVAEFIVRNRIPFRGCGLPAAIEAVVETVAVHLLSQGKVEIHTNHHNADPADTAPAPDATQAETEADAAAAAARSPTSFFLRRPPRFTSPRRSDED